MSAPRVSIVVPCYNLGHYLAEAVDSVLGQSFTDVEILVVDDGSRPGAFSLTMLFDRAAAAGRLYGLRLEGLWMHVGTPEAVKAAEAALIASAA